MWVRLSCLGHSTDQTDDHSGSAEETKPVLIDLGSLGGCCGPEVVLFIDVQRCFAVCSDLTAEDISSLRKELPYRRGHGMGTTDQMDGEHLVILPGEPPA